LYAGRIRQQTSQELEQRAELRAVTTSIAQSFKTVRLFQLEALTRTVFERQLRTAQCATFQRVRHASLYGTSSVTVLGLVEMMVMIAASLAVVLTGLSIGGMMAFMNTYWQAVNGVQSLIDTVPLLAGLSASLERLEAFQVEDMDAPRWSQSTGNVRFDAVSFGFNEAAVLDGFCLSLAPGERVLLEGPNGSGKSTVAHLIAGLLAPQRGSLERPTSVVAVVEPILFPHLPLCELTASLSVETVAELGERLGLGEQFDKLPSMLSLGQRKKLSLLMALAQPRADCYVFDEPLANLDDASQGQVLELIFERTRGSSLLVILHGGEVWRSRFDRTVRLLAPSNVAPNGPQDGIVSVLDTGPTLASLLGG
jgi:ABC-type bacteriocin/lantibiotic exporter with double-glycine peptidase domain